MIKEFGVIFISLFILILLFSHTSSASNNFYALAQNATVSNLPPNVTNTTSGVKITFPEKGSTVPINLNSSFIVKGISKDTTTTDCQVLVIVNNVKPYQNAQPMNKNGNEDYSEWQFALTKNYTIIIEGTNKITSKFSCLNNPQSSHYSVNVTGASSSVVSNATTAPVVSNATTAPVVSNATTAPVVSNATTAPVVSNATTAPVVSNATTAPVVSNATTAPVVSSLTNQQPVSQILAPNENSQSDPICCKTIDYSGVSSSNAGNINNDEIARLADEEDEDDDDEIARLADEEDEDDDDEIARLADEEDEDDDDEIARLADEEDEDDDDEIARLADEEDEDDDDEIARLADEEDEDDDDEIARLADEEDEDDDDETTEYFLDDFFDEVEYNLQSAGVNINLN